MRVGVRTHGGAREINKLLKLHEPPVHSYPLASPRLAVDSALAERQAASGAAILPCRRILHLRDQRPNFALHGKLKAIGRFDQIDLHSDVRHINLLPANVVTTFALEPQEHGLKVPNGGTTPVDGSRKACGMRQHQSHQEGVAKDSRGDTQLTPELGSMTSPCDLVVLYDITLLCYYEIHCWGSLRTNVPRKRHHRRSRGLSHAPCRYAPARPSC